MLYCAQIGMKILHGVKRRKHPVFGIFHALTLLYYYIQLNSTDALKIHRFSMLATAQSSYAHIRLLKKFLISIFHTIPVKYLEEIIILLLES